jgi:exosortase
MKNYILFLLWAVVFFPLYPSLIMTWLNDTNNSHGLLVPFVSMYFIYKKRNELRNAPIRTSKLGAVILLISIAIYLVSYAGDVSVLARAMMVISLTGLILYNFGASVYRLIAFPLTFLVFMVPLPDSVVGLVSNPLQRFATDVSAALISLARIPVYQEGNMLYFVQTKLEVAEACSGLHSLVALLVLGFLFLHLSRMDLKGKAILIASTVPIALITNIVRVTGTGILAHFYGAKMARGFLHDFSGIAVFAFGFGMLSIVHYIVEHYTISSRIVKNK